MTFQKAKIPQLCFEPCVVHYMWVLYVILSVTVPSHRLAVERPGDDKNMLYVIVIFTARLTNGAAGHGRQDLQGIRGPMCSYERICLLFTVHPFPLTSPLPASLTLYDI